MKILKKIILILRKQIVFSHTEVDPLRTDMFFQSYEKEVFEKKVEDKIEQIILPSMSVSDVESLNINADIFFCSLGTTIKTAVQKKNLNLLILS